MSNTAKAIAIACIIAGYLTADHKPVETETKQTYLQAITVTVQGADVICIIRNHAISGLSCNWDAYNKLPRGL